MSKPKVIKEFDKLDEDIKQAVFKKFPYGFDRHIITFKNHKKKLVSALPFETEDRFYMIKMTRAEANKIAQKWDEDENEEVDTNLDDVEEISNTGESTDD